MRRLLLLAVSVFLWTPPAEATVQVALGRLTTLAAAATRYFCWFGSSSANATETARIELAGANATLTHLLVSTTAAPGAGTSWTFTLRKNGAGTIISCVIADTATTCEDKDSTVSVSPGDRINYEVVATGATAAADASAAILYIGTTANQVTLSGGTAGTSLPTTGITYFPIPNVDAPATPQTVYNAILPMAGTLSGFYTQLSGAPDNGAGTQTYTFRVQVNATNTGITCAISEAATTCNDLVNTFAVATGDLIEMEAEVTSGTPTARRAGVGLLFTTTDNRVFPLIFNDGSSLSATTTEYTFLQSSSVGWGTPETNRTEIVHPMRITELYADTTVAPANGAGTQSFTLTLRRNQADMPLSCTMSETDTSCSATGASMVFDRSDTGTTKIVPAGTPAVTGTLVVSYVAQIGELFLNGATLNGFTGP